MSGRGKRTFSENGCNRSVPEGFRSKEYRWLEGGNRAGISHTGHKTGPQQRGRGMHRHGRASESAIHHRKQGAKGTGTRGSYRTETFSSASNPEGQGRFGPGLQFTAQGWHSRHRRIRSRRPRVRPSHKTPLLDQHKKAALDIGQSNSNGRHTERFVNMELPSSSGTVTKSSPAGARSAEVLSDQQTWPGIAQAETESQQAVADQRVDNLNVSDASYRMTTCGDTEGITPTPLFYARLPESDHSDNGHTYPDLEYNNSSRDLEAQKLFTLPARAGYQSDPAAVTTQLECLPHYHQSHQSYLDLHQAPGPLLPQNYTPEYLYLQQIPDYLPSDNNPYYFWGASFAYPAASIRGRVSGGCSPASVAMSISSGEAPDFESPYGKTDLNFHGEHVCIRCKGPNSASLGLLVCCSRCYQCYHTSCHDPPIGTTGGEIVVGTGTWKCRWCIDRFVNSVSGSASGWLTPDQSFPLRGPNSRDGLSEKSSGLRSKGSTRMDLSPTGLGGGSPSRSWDGRYRNEGHRHLTRGPAARRQDDTAMGVDNPGEFHYNSFPTANRLENGSVCSGYTDEEWSRSRSPYRNPTEEDEMSRYGYQQHPADLHMNANIGIEEREHSYYSDSLSRSASIFSGKPAVLTNSQPRSRSTSSNRYQAREWNRAPQALRDSREDTVPTGGFQDERWHRAQTGDSRGGVFPTNGYQYQGWNESSQTVGGFREEDLTHEYQDRWYPTSRPMGDMQEIEADLTDGSMSLDSPGGRSPSSYANRSPRRFSDSHTVGLAMDMSLENVPNKPRESSGSARVYSHAKDTNRDIISKGYDRKGSPLCAPGIEGDHRYVSYRPGNRMMIGTPSPPYSPPPPDPANKRPKSYHQGQHPPDVLATSQINRGRSSSLESVISCRRCHSDMAHLDSQKGDICQPCVRKEHCRNSAQPTLDHHDSSGATATPHQPRTPSSLQSRIGRNAAPKVPPSAPAAMRLSKDSVHKDSNFGNSPSANPRPPPAPRPALQTARFQTAKQRVIERYQMRVPEAPKARSRSPQVRRTASRGQDKRKIPDPPRSGGSKVARMELPRRTKPANIPSRQKVPSLGSPLKIHPPSIALAKTVGRLRSTTYEAPTFKTDCIVKKPARRGPAMKSAGGSVSREIVAISSDGDEDISVLEKKLQEQKGFTRKQAEKAAELQVKLKESRREKEKLQKELAAALAANQKHVKQQDSGEDKPSKGLVCRGQTHPGQKAAGSDLPLQLDAVGGDERTPDSPKGLSMRELYSGLTFNSDSPWGTFELPDPDPTTFRKHGWRKTTYKPYDDARLMSVHLHRQVNRTREPAKILTQPPLDSEGSTAAAAATISSGTTALNGPAGSDDVEMTDGIQQPGGGGHQIAFDEFMGVPDNMVPYVKDGSLGFRSGSINPRTGRLERNVPHYRIRLPGDLKVSI